MGDFMVFIKDNLVVSAGVLVATIGIFIYVIRLYKGGFFGGGLGAIVRRCTGTGLGTGQKKNPLINNASLDDDVTAEFIPALAFDGQKPGYVFKTSNKGTGYYKDTDN